MRERKGSENRDSFRDRFREIRRRNVTDLISCDPLARSQNQWKTKIRSKLSERIARGLFHRFQSFSSTVSHLHPFFLEKKQIRAIIKNRIYLNFPCKIIQNYPKFLFHHPCPLLFSIIIKKLSSKYIFFRERIIAYEIISRQNRKTNFSSIA